ncbi:MAG: Fe-S cluster domain-containing protein [Spirochaetes bacterium]|nr:Fe-S cluster domain-containing protein [Spirochaetota bacterium]
MLLQTAIYAVLAMIGLGLIFGFFISFANRKWAVEVDPRIHEVDEVLPKGQCGGCGYPGCMAYAEAVVTNPDVPPNLCAPGKEAVAQKVAEITGKKAVALETKIAFVRCSGTYGKAIRTGVYKGVKDCVSANILVGGDKGCTYGCLGYGTCVKVCMFDALKMSPEGIPVVNPDKCTGCGKCVTVCPRNIITLVKPEIMVKVNCNSRDKGAIVRKHCQAGCIGCGMCAKSCPYGAIVIDNFLAIVDHNICLEKCSDPVCMIKCPTKVLRPAIWGTVPGFEVKEEKV